MRRVSKRFGWFDMRVLLRGVLLIAALVAMGALLEEAGVRALLETGWIDAEIRGKGFVGEALFLLVGMAFTAIGLPRQIVSFMAGYAFGFLAGAALALLATLSGALVAFWYARLVGRDFFARHFHSIVKKIDEFLIDNTGAMTLVLRLSPFSNNLVTNLAAGVSGAKPWPFFGGTVLGYLPQTVVFALLGSGFQLDPIFRTTLSLALFVLSTALGLWLWRRYHNHPTGAL